MTNKISGVKLNIRFNFLNGKSSADLPKCERGEFVDSPELGQNLSHFFPSVSSQPIFEGNITEETLSAAAEMYFYLVRCPENVKKSFLFSQFYQDLIGKHSLRTVLLTLGKTPLHSSRKPSLLA